MDNLTFHLVNPSVILEKITHKIKCVLCTPEILSLEVGDKKIKVIVRVGSDVLCFFSDNNLKSLKGQNRHRWIHVEKKIIALIKKELY